MDPAAFQVLHHVLDARRRGEHETVSLPGADLRGAQLMRADLVGAALPGCGLDHAQLAGAKLVGANLTECMLQHADLGGADLTEADLRGSDLSFARLEGASLAGADLRGADIHGIVGEPANVSGAVIDRATAERSGLGDAAVVQLWRAGARVENLEAFSYTVQRACSPDAEKLRSDAGPPRRHVSEAQMAAVKLKAGKEREQPPSSRVDPDAAGDDFDFIPEPSIRSQQLINAEPLEAMKEAPPWKTGDRVMGVTLGPVIGEGNAGTVWRAEDDDGQAFAVKLFSHRQAIVGLSLSAYQRGVSVMNRLTGLGDQAAGVVPLHAVSLNQLGVVMALADNGSAQDLPALRWSVKDTVAFVEEVARILGRAHAAGALHRCLKPSNILLDADLRPMVSDFDMVDLPTLASTKRDGGGYKVFAAPEEMRGQGTQSPTADIFSLGCLLRFLLLGEPPEEVTGEVPGLGDLADQPPGLVRIIRKCCLRAPERRYQTTEELLADLARYGDAAEEVGVDGTAAAGFGPYHVSALSHDTPWLDAEDRASRAGGLRKTSRVSTASKTAARRPGRAPAKATDADAAIGMSRGAEKGVGTLGTFVLLGSVLAVVLIQGPSSELVARMHYVSVFGGALASFLLPRAANRALLWRLVGLILLAGLFYLLNLPRLLVV